MSNKDNNDTTGLSPNSDKLIEQAADAWVRLCLANIEQKRQLINQDKDKNTYESTAK